MSITLFTTILIILSLVASLITEACKKIFKDKKYSTNILVAAISAIVGWGGGTAVYIFTGMAFSLVNVTALILFAPAVWLIATVGYDKVIQTIQQIKILL